jgi:uncharacterized membrane protein
MLPRADVVELDMSVDEALKYVVSMGTVAPGDRGAVTGAGAPPLPASAPVPPDRSSGPS